MTAAAAGGRICPGVRVGLCSAHVCIEVQGPGDLDEGGKCRCIPLYQACTLYLIIVEDGDGEYGGAMMLLFGK